MASRSLTFARVGSIAGISSKAAGFTGRNQNLRLPRTPFPGRLLRPEPQRVGDDRAQWKMFGLVAPLAGALILEESGGSAGRLASPLLP